MEQVIYEHGKIVWLYGQPESGKTTLAKELHRTNPSSILIDGDELRSVTGNYDYSALGRIRNITQASIIAKFLCLQGKTVIVSLVTPFRMIRSSIKDENLFFVYLKSARTSRAHLNSEFEPPTGNDDDLIVNTSLEMESCIDDIKTYTGLK